MRLIDTHCHLNLQNYKDDADDVIRRSLESEVEMIIVGTDYKSSKRALDLANRYQKGVYVAVGMHPGSMETRVEHWSGESREIQGEIFNAVAYQQLAKFPKVVAIGEIGLDYFQPEIGKLELSVFKQRQKQILWDQLELALQLKLPVIIHCRQAHDDLLEMLSRFKKQYKDLLPPMRPWGVIHCFSGDEKLAWQYFALDMCISFTGLITFSKQWDSLIKKMPSDRLLLETDAPFLTPEPYRGKRNEPILVKHVAERLAAIRAISPERVAEFTTDNARHLFNL